MSVHLRKAVEQERNFYIRKLLNSDAYKNNHLPLYDYTLSQLKKEYLHLLK